MGTSIYHNMSGARLFALHAGSLLFMQSFWIYNTVTCVVVYHVLDYKCMTVMGLDPLTPVVFNSKGRGG